MSGSDRLDLVVTTQPPDSIRPDYMPHARAERLIAAGRFVLAASSLTAIYLEPSTPAQYQRATYGLLAVYTVYAFVTTVIAWRSPVPPARWRLLSHALDLVLFSVFVYLTEGPASPFFLYFVFSLFCATLRFSWRGVLATGVAAMAIYSAMAIIASHGDADFEASRAIIRVVYLGVISALLVYLGLYHHQLRTELASLAAWPRELAARMDDVLRLSLAHAGLVLRAPRVLLIWEDTEEPWVYAAIYERDAFRIDRAPPATYDAPAIPRNCSVHTRDARAPMLIYDPLYSTVTEAPGDPVGSAVRQRYRIESAIVASMESETLAARLVIPDVRAATADDLALAHIVGRLVLAALEQFFFVQQVQQTASAEERLRISRDLHDGIVQSLAGVGLRLQAMRGRFPERSDNAEELRQMQSVLERDQRELRTLVRELRPHDARDGETIIAEELRRMGERFPLEWGLEIAVERPDPVRVTARVAHEVCRILNESLSNAARHGNASRAVIAVSGHDGFVDIRVADNGRGFTFSGSRDLDSLERTGEGPRTLKERVRKLGGSLCIESSGAGASIDIRIPVSEDIR